MNLQLILTQKEEKISPAVFKIWVQGKSTANDIHIFLVMTEASYEAFSGNVVVTWDGSVKSMYIDSVLQPGSNANTSPVLNSISDLFIGADDASSEFYTGAIDEVAIYDQALDATQVQILYLSY